MSAKLVAVPAAASTRCRIAVLAWVLNQGCRAVAAAAARRAVTWPGISVMRARTRSTARS